jgi:hypothetical protein
VGSAEEVDVEFSIESFCNYLTSFQLRQLKH